MLIIYKTKCMRELKIKVEEEEEENKKKMQKSDGVFNLWVMFVYTILFIGYLCNY